MRSDEDPRPSIAGLCLAFALAGAIAGLGGLYFTLTVDFPGALLALAMAIGLGIVGGRCCSQSWHVWAISASFGIAALLASLTLAEPWRPARRYRFTRKSHGEWICVVLGHRERTRIPDRGEFRDGRAKADGFCQDSLRRMRVQLDGEHKRRVPGMRAPDCCALAAFAKVATIEPSVGDKKRERRDCRDGRCAVLKVQQHAAARVRSACAATAYRNPSGEVKKQPCENGKRCANDRAEQSKCHRRVTTGHGLGYSRCFVSPRAKMLAT